MKSKNIRILVILATFSILGVAVNQFFWIGKQNRVKEELLAIQEQNILMERQQFENKVTLALIDVRDILLSMNKENQQLYLEPVQQITPNYFVVSFYDTINAVLLQNLLVESFNEYQIKEVFEYGVYDCFSDSIIFDHYVDLSTSDMKSGITNSSTPKQKWNHDGHYFGVYFPDKKDPKVVFNESVFSSALIISTLIIVIAVLIFSYAIVVILRQKKLSEVRTDFINNMTHELKTPISTIAISSDFLLNEGVVNFPDKIKRYAYIIKMENKRLENQVERVLQMAKLERGEIQLKKESVHIHEIINSSIDFFELLIQQRSGKLELDLNATGDKVFGDVLHLTNVMYNLMDNANKYTKAGPVVKISSYNKNGGICVEFKDNGIGMTTDHQKLIFDKFYRVPTGSVHDVKGFGLGLFYVKTIIEKHGGTIHVNSEINKGTVFTIWLPLQ